MRELTREEIAAELEMHGPHETMPGLCKYPGWSWEAELVTYREWPCPIEEALHQALALLDLRRDIETKERGLLQAAAQAAKESGMDAWDRSRKLHHEADEWRALLPPAPKGGRDG